MLYGQVSTRHRTGVVIRCAEVKLYPQLMDPGIHISES